MPRNYHNAPPTNDSIVRIDQEWNQRTGRHTTLIESTNATDESFHNTVRIVLPHNAPVDQVFPVVVYRRLPNELLPNIELGTISPSTGAFVTTQTFLTKRYLSPHLPELAAGDASYHIDVKALHFHTDTERWELISRVPQSRTIVKHLVIEKDNHIQKHFLAEDD